MRVQPVSPVVLDGHRALGSGPRREILFPSRGWPPVWTVGWQQGDVRKVGRDAHSAPLCPWGLPPCGRGSLRTSVIASLDTHLFVSLSLYVKLCSGLLGSSRSLPVALVTEIGVRSAPPGLAGPAMYYCIVTSAALPGTSGTRTAQARAQAQVYEELSGSHQEERNQGVGGKG